MADLNVRSDSVDVEQIMRQIRARVREKRGVDYTEAELQQLAGVKLEKFLDPRGVRSDLVEQFKKHRVVSPAPPSFSFDDTTLYETHRGYLRFIRKLFKPFLLLFLNPNRITDALHTQAEVNALNHRLFRQREEMDPLFYEVIHNLVVEITRLGVEVHNLKMRVESLSSRMDFDERRGRALESVVEYKRQNQRPSGGQRHDQRHDQQQGQRHDQQQSQRQDQQQDQRQAPAASGGDNDARPAGNGRPVEGIRPEFLARPEGAGPESEGRPEGGARPEGGGRPEGGARPEGGGRRRRRRRRRRPGQNMADRMQGGRPNGESGAMAPPADFGGAADSGPEDTNGHDDGGPDDGDEGAGDQ